MLDKIGNSLLTILLQLTYFSIPLINDTELKQIGIKELN